jgi:cytochrome P450
MATDLRPDQRMTDDEVLAQITTFVSPLAQRQKLLTNHQMLAGNETSSTALTWALYALAQNPASQDKLREELMAVGDERPGM